MQPKEIEKNVEDQGFKLAKAIDFTGNKIRHLMFAMIKPSPTLLKRYGSDLMALFDKNQPLLPSTLSDAKVSSFFKYTVGAALLSVGTAFALHWALRGLIGTLAFAALTFIAVFDAIVDELEERKAKKAGFKLDGLSEEQRESATAHIKLGAFQYLGAGLVGLSAGTAAFFLSTSLSGMVSIYSAIWMFFSAYAYLGDRSPSSSSSQSEEPGC